MSREEQRAQSDFGLRYSQTAADVTLEIERRVLGQDYGGNGYTTEPQVRRLESLLGLGPGDRLLDLGSGCGWPGLYLARRSGCRVVCADLPLPGLRRAIERGIAEGTRCHTVAASARHLAFPDRAFDAVVHGDLLC